MLIVCFDFSEQDAIDEAERQAAEDEAKEMTLDQYRAIQAEERGGKSGFKTRKAGEGVDDKQWKKMYVLKKKVNESDDDEEYEVRA